MFNFFQHCAAIQTLDHLLGLSVSLLVRLIYRGNYFAGRREKRFYFTAQKARDNIELLPTISIRTGKQKFLLSVRETHDFVMSRECYRNSFYERRRGWIAAEAVGIRDAQ